jgi:hypothetical protein
MYPNSGYGGGFRNWLFSAKQEPYNSWGNGSAMRVSSVGWWCDTLRETEKLAECSAAVTHNHPEGIKGACATAGAIFLLRNGATKSEIKTYIEREYNYDLSRTLDQIRPVYKFNESCQETVPEAIIAFLESTDFEDAIRNAISLGGDSDTLAAVTGSLAEAAYGVPEQIKIIALSFLDTPLLDVYKRWENKILMKKTKGVQMSNNPFKSESSETILWEFLEYPLNSTAEIFQRFAGLPNATWHKGVNKKEQFVYIKGTRPDRCTLIAHADTVFMHVGEHQMIYHDGVISSAISAAGIGADDRAGCAILWLLRNSGHNLLILDEEHGQHGAWFLRDSHPDILAEIQASSFMLEFDRINATDYKVYDIPVTEEFRSYIETKTGYKDAGPGSFTDICVLCTAGCCAANLSVGFYDEHREEESINVSDWLNTYNIVKKMLELPLSRFELYRD